MFAAIRRQKANSAKQRDNSTSLLQVGRDGGSHADWVSHAIQAIRDTEDADRIGVWLGNSQSAEPTGTGPVIFRGDVWERGLGSGPPDWTRLSDEAPLPIEHLRDGKSCESDLEGADSGFILGPLIEMGRALWVPVTVRRALRGIVLLASRHARAPLTSGHVERVAEELAVLLELEEARRLAALRKADLELEERVRGLVAEDQSANMILGKLAESCTRGTALGGIGAVFVLIGEHKTGLPVSSASAVGEQLVVRALSGEDHWARAVNQGPLESLWRQAIGQQQVVTTEPDSVVSRNEISRIVAIPFAHGKEFRGALLAGFPKQRPNPEAVNRLELRAVLASEIFERERQAEAALRQKQWEWALLESSEKPVVLINRQGCMRGMSGSARAIVAATDALPETLRFVELFRSTERERVHQWLESGSQRKLRPGELSLECELNAGSRVLLSSLPLSSTEFSAISLEQAADGKQRRKIEQAEEALRQAIQWLEEGVIIFDESGEILARNAPFLRILGLSDKQEPVLHNLDDLIRETSANFVAPELFATEWRALARNGSDATREELAMERPMPQLIERYARPIFAPGGKKLGRVEVYRELSARCRFESRVAQAEKLASIGLRVTGILHELSNPLTTILGNAQRMVLRGEPASQPPEVRRILDEAERATSIVRQLLHFSRDVHSERCLISLNEPVERAVDLQRASLTGTSLRLQVDVAERLPRVSGDAAQLQQVLLNLLQNAQQAIQQAGRGTTIGVRTSVVGPDRVRLEVWDDGPGIPDALQSRIFDPFFTTKPEGIGTGLGLAIVRRFVAQHGGSISVVSPPEGGVRFVVELPAAEQLSNAKRRAVGEAEIPPRSSPLGLLQASATAGPVAGAENAHVLVVENEAAVAHLIADVLRDEGMTVDVLPDGLSALAAIGNSSYTLAICDLNMPGIGGEDFYANLLQAKNPLSSRLLFVTGDVSARPTQEFFEQNRLRHLPKPFRVEELSQAVHQILGDRNAIAQASNRQPD
jgi:signal transduction histidine kinase/ActR/RegA family two-component response regulator